MQLVQLLQLFRVVRQQPSRDTWLTAMADMATYGAPAVPMGPADDGLGLGRGVLQAHVHSLIDGMTKAAAGQAPDEDAPEMFYGCGSSTPVSPFVFGSVYADPQGASSVAAMLVRDGSDSLARGCSCVLSSCAVAVFFPGEFDVCERHRAPLGRAARARRRLCV